MLECHSKTWGIRELCLRRLFFMYTSQNTHHDCFSDKTFIIKSQLAMWKKHYRNYFSCEYEYNEYNFLNVTYRKACWNHNFCRKFLHDFSLPNACMKSNQCLFLHCCDLNTWMALLYVNCFKIKTTVYLFVYINVFWPRILKRWEFHLFPPYICTQADSQTNKVL